MNQDDWDLYLKSASNSGKRYQSYYQQKKKEEEDKKKNEIAFGGSDPNSKAAKVEQSKGFFSGVGDVLGGIKDTVAGSAKGAADFTSAMVDGGLRDLVGEVTGQNDIIRNNQQKTLEQNTDMVKLSGKKMNDASLSDEERERWKKLFHKYSSDNSSYKEAEEYNQGQIDRSTQAIEGAADAYKTAQYIPGFSLGAEGVGTLAAMADGDDSTTNKALIKLAQDTDWDELSDEEKKAALAQRNIGGALSTLDLLPVAGKVAGTAVKTGVKTGLKSGVKAGVKEAIEAGGKAYGKSIGSKTIKEVASVGAGQLAKQSVKSTAGGAVLGAGLGVGLNAVMGGDDWQGAAVQGAVGGAVGGFIGSPLDIDVKAAIKASGKNSLDAPDEVIDAVIKEIDATEAKSADEAAYLASRKAEFEEIKANRAEGLNDDGSRIINLDETNKNLEDMQAGRYSDDLYDVTTTDGKAADPEFIQAATEKQVATLTAKRDEIAAQVDSIESPAAREMAMANVNKLDDQIAAITSGDTKALMDTGDTGLSRTLNTERVRERFGQLQDDLAEGNFRQRREQRKAEARTRPSRTYDSVSDDIDNLGAGGVAPEAVTPREDFVDIEELPSVEKLPSQLRYRAESLANDRREIEFQRSQLMTDERANQVLDQATDDYNAKLERIEMMPEPRRTAEMDKLQSEFNAKYEEVQAQLAKDAQTVSELRRVEEQINANSMELLTDANVLKDTHPQDFGTIDQELNAKISQEVEAETETAIFNRMSNEDGVPDAENVSKAFAEIPEGAAPEVLDNSPATNNLAQEALTDLWTNDEANLLEHNLQGVSRSSLGLGLSSPSHNIRRMFGEVGRLVNGSILEAFHKTNLASKHDAALFTKIQKAFGGDRAVYKAAVDIVEGKLDVDDAGFTKQQLDGLEMFQGFWERSKRMVQKASAQEVMADFDTRSYNGDFKYKTEEIKSLAKRDGISIAEATQKYRGNTGFKKNDVIYLANQASANSTRQNYFAHMLDEELVSKNVKQEFRDSVTERQQSGEFRYTDDELAILASRDGTGIEAARAKYGERGFNKRDAGYVERIIAHDAVTRAKKDFGGDSVTANIKFGNMMKRLTDSDNYSRDIIDVMAKYSAGLNKKVYLEPALRKLDNVKLVLEKSKIDTKVAKDWINTYEKQLKISGVSKTGEAFNEAVDALIRKAKPDSSMIGNNHYRSSLAAQRLINTFGMLGLSFRNGLQQTSQITTAVGKLGWENVAPGMIEHVKNMSNPKTRAAYRQSLERASVINAGFVDDAFTDLIGSTHAKAVQDTGEFLSKYLMFMSRVTDEFVRGTTYQAALRDGLSSKLPMGKAQTRAAAMAAELNFLTTKADMPTKLNSDGIRSLTQFLTFSYKQAEAWKDIGIDSVKDPVTGAFKFKPKELQRVLQGIVTAGVAFQMMESVAGIDTEDNIPFLGNFTDGSLPMSPLMSLTIGRENQPGIPQLLNDIANPDGADDYEREQNRQDSMEKFRDMLIRSFVPAGSQIKKSVDGYNSMQNDGVVMKDGRVRFIQNAKPDDMLKNPVLFGQYATDDGKEWVDKKFPTLSEKQSEILQQQKSQEAKQRAYDFYSGLKSVGRKDNITPKVKDIMKTQPAKAERLIRSHNEAVQKAVEAYTSQYGELSEYEQDYLMRDYFITNGTLENMNEE